VDETRLIKRICGHETPFTFKKNERYGRQRFAKFMATKCPACTVAEIQAREAAQKAAAKQRKDLVKRIKARKAAEAKAKAQQEAQQAQQPPAASN
jgi:hypothetical protein